MSQTYALLPAARSMSARTAETALRDLAQTRHDPAEMPDTRRTDILLEETMLNDLYLMSANPSLEAATRRNFEHRTLTFAEMAASGKRRERFARRADEQSANRTKGLFLTMLEGVLRT